MPDLDLIKQAKQERCETAAAASGRGSRATRPGGAVNSARRAAAQLPDGEALAMTSVAAAAHGVIFPDEAVTPSQLVAVSRSPGVSAQPPRRDISIPRVSGRSREGDRVADVGKAGDVGEGALEAEAKAGVRDSAVAAEVAVPGVVFLVDAALGRALVQDVEPLLALAATDDLADPRRQNVHCGDSAATVIEPHVKGFDGLRVVHHDDRLLRVFLSQIALVLRLQVDAPVDREFEFHIGALEHFDRLAVIHMHEFRADDALELRDQPLLDALIEEGEVL